MSNNLAYCEGANNVLHLLQANKLNRRITTTCLISLSKITIMLSKWWSPSEFQIEAAAWSPLAAISVTITCSIISGRTILRELHSKIRKKWIIFYSCHGLLWFRQPLWVPAPVRSLTTMSGPLQTWEKNFRRSRRTADRFVTRTWHQPARGSTTTSSRRRLTAGPSSKVWPWTRPWWRIPWKEKNTRRPNFVNLVGSCEISSPTTKELR